MNVSLLSSRKRAPDFLPDTGLLARVKSMASQFPDNIRESGAGLMSPDAPEKQ